MRKPSARPGAASKPPHAPLRLQVFSDLHVDARSIVMPQLAPDVDAVVVAGDVRSGADAAFQVLRAAIPQPVPIVMVLGNHEHYRGFYEESVAQARHRSAAYGISLLENASAVIGGVRFVGATLWTDYALDGAECREAAMSAARRGMNDHRLIGWSREAWRPFRPENAAALHQASSDYIAAVLAEPFAGPSVVVTHHAPHPASVHPRYQGDPVNAAFASDKSALIAAGKPVLWIHGHVHSSFDYHVGSTRILCNPNGYGAENPDFDAQLVVEVAR